VCQPCRPAPAPLPTRRIASEPSTRATLCLQDARTIVDGASLPKFIVLDYVLLESEVCSATPDFLLAVFSTSSLSTLLALVANGSPGPSVGHSTLACNRARAVFRPSMLAACGRGALLSFPLSARQIFNASSHALCPHPVLASTKAAANAQVSAICVRPMLLSHSKRHATDILLQPCGDVLCETEAIRHAWQVVTRPKSSDMTLWLFSVRTRAPPPACRLLNDCTREKRSERFDLSPCGDQLAHSPKGLHT